jgi:hypothetical protein
MHRRFCCFAAAFFMAGTVVGQNPTAEDLIRQMPPPDVIVNVYKHAAGADMLEITVKSPDYPDELLVSQAQRLAEILGSEIRGLEVGFPMLGGGVQGQFKKLACSVDGLIRRDLGTLELEPIVMALAGAPAEHEIDSIQIIFAGERPTEDTLHTYPGKSITVAAVALPDPPTIDYRIQLHSQNPDDLQIPDFASLQAEPPTETRIGKPVSDEVVFSFIIAAGLAAGALVYFAVARPRSR